MHLASLSKRFRYRLIFGYVIRNGLTFSSSLYPIKYVKPFLPKETLLR